MTDMQELDAIERMTISAIEFVPQLVHGFWHISESRHVYVSADWEHAFSFSDAERKLIQKFAPGKNIRFLVQEFIAEGLLFDDFLTVLLKLSAADLLVQKFKTNLNEAPEFLKKLDLLASLPLKANVSMEILSARIRPDRVNIAAPLCFLVVFGSIALWILHPMGLNTGLLFQFRGHFLLGAIFSWLTLSFIDSLANIISWYAFRTCTGVEEKVELRVGLLGVRVDFPNAAAFHFLDRMDAVFLFLFQLGTLPFLAMAINLLVSDPGVRSQIFFSSLILLLYHLRPERLNLLISALNSKALARATPASWRESRWVLLGFYAWTLGFFLLSFSLLKNLVPVLFLHLRTSVSVFDRGGAVGIIFALLVAFTLGIRHAIRLRPSTTFPSLKGLRVLWTEKILRRDWHPGDFEGFLRELAALHPLKNVSDVGLRTLCEHGRLSLYRRGANLFEVGSEESQFFILIQGTVQIRAKTPAGLVRVAEVREGGVIGEVAGLEEVVRTSTGSVSSDKALVLTVPQTALMLLRAASDITDFEVVRAQLQLSHMFLSCPMFQGFPRELVHHCLQSGSWRQVRAQENIVISERSGFCFILSGTFQFEIPGFELRTLEAGESFGESSLLNPPDAQAAQLICVEDGFIFQMNEDQFWELLSDGLVFWMNFRALKAEQISS